MAMVLLKFLIKLDYKLNFIRNEEIVSVFLMQCSQRSWYKLHECAIIKMCVLIELYLTKFCNDAEEFSIDETVMETNYSWVIQIT